MTLDITVIVWLESRKLRLPGAIGECSFRFLSPADILTYSTDATTDLNPAMADRLYGGSDYCMGGFVGSRLVSYAWFALGSIEAEHNRGAQPRSGVAVSFPVNVAFLYKGFTHPEFRGRKLHGELIGRSLLDLGPLGVDTLVSTTDVTNRAARTALAGIGCEELGRCYRWGWGPWMHTWAPRGLVQRGVRFGADAEVQPRIDPHRLPPTDRVV